MSSQENRIALLIDADNAPASKITRILTEVHRRGTPHIQRAYGNWKSPHLKPWEDVLHKSAIQPIQQFAYTAKKNATDIAMAIDAIDLLHTKPVDAFALVTSDADFTPLVMRLRAGGVKVFGLGEQKTPAPYKRACSDFILLEDPVKPKTVISKPEPAAAEPDSGAKIRKGLGNDIHHLQMLRSVVDDSKKADGWSKLSEVGSRIGKQPTFMRIYGSAKLSKLIESIPQFEIRRQDLTVYVRNSSQK